MSLFLVIKIDSNKFSYLFNTLTLRARERTTIREITIQEAIQKVHQKYFCNLGAPIIFCQQENLPQHLLITYRNLTRHTYIEYSILHKKQTKVEIIQMHLCTRNLSNKRFS